MDVLNCLGLLNLRRSGVQQPGLGEVGLRNLEHGRLLQRIDLQAVGISGSKGIAHDLVIQRGGSASDGVKRSVPLCQLRQRGQQRPGVGVLGIVEDLLAGTDLNNLTAIQNGNTVSNVGNNTQVMSDENDGVVEFLLQILDQLQNLCLNGPKP